VLKEGDIIKIDCGAIYKGWIADSAWTFPVGNISPEAARLLEVTEGALYASIKEAKVGNHTGDISFACQQYVESHGFNVVRDYVSHGVGRRLHEDPQITNFGEAGTGSKLRQGMTIALEPMVLAGTYKTRLLPDQWTVVAKDGKLTAHFEHTIAVTTGDAEILTKLN
jgi:methionyl aminopeptidase